jgi:hypothetical protein
VQAGEVVVSAAAQKGAAVVVAAFTLIVLLGGCGGHSGDANKVALIARSWSHAKGGSCSKVRAAALSGRIVTLYSCTMTDVPPQYRIAGSFDNPTQHYCFAFANDAGLRVEQFGSRCEKGQP